MSEREASDRPEAIRRSLASPTSGEESLRRKLLEVLLAPAEPRKITYEKFLAWADEDTLAEWVDGEVVMYSPASKRHQSIADFLTGVLRIFVEQHDLGVVLSAPFQMKLEHGREPDLLFVASEHLERLKETYLDGPADLVIEIISPESRLRDRGEKFAEYEMGGVREYWLIDSEQQGADFYRLGERGRYRPVDPDEHGIYHSWVVSDFWLRVDWLWQEPLPAVLEVLREQELI